MDSEMPYFLIWSLCIKRLVHHAVYLFCLLSILCNPFIIYEIFHLLSGKTARLTVANSPTTGRVRVGMAHVQ